MRLRHSNASGRGYRRVPAGTGFSYKGLDGTTLPPGPVRERLESIGIPPAWTDVWIAPYDNGHIQATGLDAVGRRQYIYHPTWRERKDRLKFDRALQLAETLPAARRLVTMDLRSEGLTRERVLAAAFRMLDSGSIADQVYKGTYLPLYSNVPSGFLGANTSFKDAYGDAGKPSLDKAKKVLTDAGVTSPVTLNLQYNPDHYGKSSGDEYAMIDPAACV